MRNPILGHIEHRLTGNRRPAPLKLRARATEIDSKLEEETFGILNEVRFQLRWTKIIDIREDTPDAATLRHVESALAHDLYGPLQPHMATLHAYIIDNVHDKDARDYMLSLLEDMRRFTKP